MVETDVGRHQLVLTLYRVGKDVRVEKGEHGPDLLVDLRQRFDRMLAVQLQRPDVVVEGTQ